MSAQSTPAEQRPAVAVNRLVGLFREAIKAHGLTVEVRLTAAEMKSVADFFDEAIDELADQVAQNCTMADRSLDSCALSSHASAMRLLAELGRIEITHDVGRRVIGKWRLQ
jgi:hypothetical protein